VVSLWSLDAVIDLSRNANAAAMLSRNGVSEPT
jgi:hypothetical protein